MTLEQETRGSHLTQYSSLRNLCNEKYEQEVSVLKGTPIDADYHSTTLSSWFPKAECETSKRSDAVERRLQMTKLYWILVLWRCIENGMTSASSFIALAHLWILFLKPSYVLLAFHRLIMFLPGKTVFRSVHY